MPRSPWRLTAIVAVLLGVMFGCGGGDDGGGGVAPEPGTIGIGVSPSLLTLVQGANGSVTVALTRGGGFTGSVSVSASGLPSGVTIAGATIAAGSTSATLNVSAAASAAVGNASVTITASGSGVTSSTAVLTLTIQVSAENGFDPSISVPAVDITQGASQSLTINVNRANGFAGPVTFSARNAPTGLTVSFDPMVVTGTQTTMSIEADQGLAPGDYTITIDAEADDAGAASIGAAGVSAMITKSFTIMVSIMAPGGGGTPAFSMSLSATDVRSLGGEPTP